MCPDEVPNSLPHSSCKHFRVNTEKNDLFTSDDERPINNLFCEWRFCRSSGGSVTAAGRSLVRLALWGAAVTLAELTLKWLQHWTSWWNYTLRAEINTPVWDFQDETWQRSSSLRCHNTGLSPDQWSIFNHDQWPTVIDRSSLFYQSKTLRTQRLINVNETGKCDPWNVQR